MSSETSFVSARRSLTFLGWSSSAMESYTKDTESEQEAYGPGQVHHAGDDGDGVVVRIQPEPGGHDGHVVTDHDGDGRGHHPGHHRPADHHRATGLVQSRNDAVAEPQGP